MVLATALLMVACGGSDNDSDDFQLNGIYPVEVSGIEQGVPFQAVGRMNLSTDSATSVLK